MTVPSLISKKKTGSRSQYKKILRVYCPGESNNADVGTMVWIPATGEKYHSIPNCGRMNPDTARQVSRSEAEAMGYGPCSKCY